MSDKVHNPSKGAYFGDKVKKAAAVRDMIAHRRADSFLRGYYGTLEENKNGKEVFRGCAVGCSIASAELRDLRKEKGRPLTPKEVKEFYRDFNGNAEPHERMARYYNVSPDLAQVEDFIFETLPLKDAKDWPVDFLRAINPGADLSGVVAELCVWINTEHSDWCENLWKQQAEDYIDVARVLYRWEMNQYLSPAERRVKNRRARLVRDKLLEIIKSRKAPAKPAPKRHTRAKAES